MLGRLEAPNIQRLRNAVNEVFVALGVSDWKAVISALLLPPMPALLGLALAWRWRLRRRLLAPLLLTLCLALLWLSTCQAPGAWLERQWASSPALRPDSLADLRRNLAGRKAVVLVLGGGGHPLAPEYGEAHLTDGAMQRLHYGVWLGRQTGLPLMATGGAGHAGAAGMAEAAVAGRILNRDYASALRWTEVASRDTRENARFSLTLLQAQGVQDVLLVTHGWHMKRSLRAFAQEAARMGYAVHLLAAPMGLAAPSGPALLQWLPSVDGYRRNHQTLREMIGWVSGA